MSEVKELQIEEVMSLEDYAASSSNKYLHMLEAIVAKQLSSEARQDRVAAIYIKEYNSEVADSVRNLPSLLNDPALLQSMYERECSLIGAEPKVNFSEVPAEDINAWLSNISNTIEVRPFPQLNEEFRVMSAMELSFESRNDFINKFTASVGVGKFIGELGVSKDYKPSAEALELSCLSAAMVLSFLRQNMAPSGPQPGQLYVPGR